MVCESDLPHLMKIVQECQDARDVVDFLYVLPTDARWVPSIVYGEIFDGDQDAPGFILMMCVCQNFIGV